MYVCVFAGQRHTYKYTNPFYLSVIECDVCCGGSWWGDQAADARVDLGGGLVVFVKYQWGA